MCQVTDKINIINEKVIAKKSRVPKWIPTEKAASDMESPQNQFRATQHCENDRPKKKKNFYR